MIDKFKIQRCLEILMVVKADQLGIIYMWVKQGHISKDEFTNLIEIVHPM